MKEFIVNTEAVMSSLEEYSDRLEKLDKSDFVKGQIFALNYILSEIEELKNKLKKTRAMTTDEMLIEIVSYKYKSSGFPCVFMDYSQAFKAWSITWRNPIDFSNNNDMLSKTPNEACNKAIEFINNNPKIFIK